MVSQWELKFFPELSGLPLHEQQQRLADAKAIAFGPDTQLRRWRGNIVHYFLMFTLAAGFMVLLAPRLELSQDTAAVVMLVVILPAFFWAQQRRYIALIRQALTDNVH